MQQPTKRLPRPTPSTGGDTRAAQSESASPEPRFREAAVSWRNVGYSPAVAEHGWTTRATRTYVRNPLKQAEACQGMADRGRHSSCVPHRTPSWWDLESSFFAE